MKKEYKPYTYLLGWSTHNVFYYGVEYGSKGKIAKSGKSLENILDLGCFTLNHFTRTFNV